ncbi:hypothetical protein P8825_15010 [Shouchella clausii]|uniref:hypothetical protein n=1 Tax=Shouchella clausii TaxID=79880 RepID=UPI002DBC488E|nr:hypothetical protein [Shouchella clausii]MEB5480874.1 hypothetical protein [Shouchella clausii]
MEFNHGLKGNWKAFKGFVESFNEKPIPGFYFVIEEDDCGDSAHVFDNYYDLDRWLEKIFWERERYDARSLDESMDDFKVWKLIPQSEAEKYSSLYKDARKTNIFIKGERQFRKLVTVNVQETIIVSADF